MHDVVQAGAASVFEWRVIMIEVVRARRYYRKGQESHHA